MSVLYKHFDKAYEIELEAAGDGIVNEEAFGEQLDRIFRLFEEEHSCAPQDVSFTVCGKLHGGFTAIDGAFLERIRALKELVIEDPATELLMTDGLLALLRGNHTLIRGAFDSAAEETADRYGLPFRPKDQCFLCHQEERYHETTTLTLVFHRDGRVTIEEDVSTPGSSAGNTFGGTFAKELPPGFWKTMTAGQIAEMYPGYLKEAILQDGRLAAFLQKAREKEFCTE